MTARECITERELLIELVTLLLRIRREQPSQLWLNEQFSLINRRLSTMTDQISAQHQQALDKLSGISSAVGGVKTDLQALLDAIKNSNSPPTAENWQDVLDAADGVQASVNDLDASIKSDTPSAPPPADTSGTDDPATNDPSAQS